MYCHWEDQQVFQYSQVKVHTWLPGSNSGLQTEAEISPKKLDVCWLRRPWGRVATVTWRKWDAQANWTTLSVKATLRTLLGTGQGHSMGVQRPEPKTKKHLLCKFPPLRSDKAAPGHTGCSMHPLRRKTIEWVELVKIPLCGPHTFFVHTPNTKFQCESSEIQRLPWGSWNSLLLSTRTSHSQASFFNLRLWIFLHCKCVRRLDSNLNCYLQYGTLEEWRSAAY